RLPVRGGGRTSAPPPGRGGPGGGTPRRTTPPTAPRRRRAAGTCSSASGRSRGDLRQARDRPFPADDHGPLRLFRGDALPARQGDLDHRRLAPPAPPPA